LDSGGFVSAEIQFLSIGSAAIDQSFPHLRISLVFESSCCSCSGWLAGWLVAGWLCVGCCWSSSFFLLGFVFLFFWFLVLGFGGFFSFLFSACFGSLQAPMVDGGLRFVSLIFFQVFRVHDLMIPGNC
jgi:hypothetical protein